MEQFDWDIVGAISAAVGAVVGVIAAGLKFVPILRRLQRRSTLKEEVEILKSLNPESPSATLIRSHVDSLILGIRLGSHMA